MEAIFKIRRNEVALVNADGTKSADNDARGAAPADAGSLVPPTHPNHPGNLQLVWRAPRVLVQLPNRHGFVMSNAEV